MMYGHGANFQDYQTAFAAVKRSSSAVIPASGLIDNNVIPLRQAGEKLEPQQTAFDEKRKMGNIMMAVNNYSLLTCQCGMKIKIPPGFGTNKPEITCPKCGTVHKVSVAEKMKM